MRCAHERCIRIQPKPRIQCLRSARTVRANLDGNAAKRALPAGLLSQFSFVHVTAFSLVANLLCGVQKHLRSHCNSRTSYLFSGLVLEEQAVA